jgi:hypothetical protein
VLVRADRPSVQLIKQVLHSVEGLRGPRVVALDVRVDVDAQLRARARQGVAERDALARHAELEECGDQRLVGVEQGAVEVEDRDQSAQASRGVMTDDRLARPLNAPDCASSSHRAPHVKQAHESRPSEAR